jgi:hypothetical protein
MQAMEAYSGSHPINHTVVRRSPVTNAERQIIQATDSSGTPELYA